MPRLGLGTSPLDDADAEAAVASAIDLGYRLIDTAHAYGNETGVGRALAASDVAREELFITSKLNAEWHGFQEAQDAFAMSAGKLGVDYIDLFLIHWPNPRQDRYVDAFRGLVELLRTGRVRAIGLSNFKPEHLQRVIDETGAVPDVNQIELDPTRPRGVARVSTAARHRHGVVEPAGERRRAAAATGDRRDRRAARADDRADRASLARPDRRRCRSPSRRTPRARPRTWPYSTSSSIRRRWTPSRSSTAASRRPPTRIASATDRRLESRSGASNPHGSACSQGSPRRPPNRRHRGRRRRERVGAAAWLDRRRPRAVPGTRRGRAGVRPALRMLTGSARQCASVAMGEHLPLYFGLPAADRASLSR